MHVLVIASWYKTQPGEIAATFIEEHARLLLKNNIKTGLIYPFFNGGFMNRLKGLKPTDKTFTDDGLPTYVCGESSIVPYFRRIIFKHLLHRAEEVYVAYTKKHGKPDMLHAHSVFMGGVFARYISKKYNVPYVITEHATKLILNSNDLKRFEFDIVRKVYSDAKHVFFVSGFQQAKMFEIYQNTTNSSTVIYNILNPHFSYVPLNKDSFSIVVLGGLIPRKNHRLLFDALTIVSNKKIKCNVLIIGDGALKENLLKMSRSLPKTVSTKFYGNLSRPEVFNVIKSSHVLVSTSQFETFGINLIEALAVGRPVISTPSGGPSEIVTEENGILLNSFEPEELADAILLMYENYTSYNQQKISEDCIKKFSEKAMFERLFSVYENIVPDLH